MARRTRKTGKRSSHFDDGVREVKGIVRGGRGARRKGGRRGRGDGRGGGRGEDDEDGRRERPARPTSSPMPFIVMGGVVVVGLIIVLIVSSESKSRRARAARQGGAPAGSPTGVPAPVTAAQPGAAPYSRPAPTRRVRMASAPVEFSFAGRGFDAAGHDNREFVASCGSCGAKIETRIDRCAQADCNAKLRWKKTTKCKFCCKPENLKFEDVEKVERKQGFCALCRGSGRNPKYRMSQDHLPFGMSRGGSSSGSTGGGRFGKCLACKGSGGCRWCKGNGWITIADYFD